MLIKAEEPPQLEVELARTLLMLEKQEIGSEEYAKTLALVERLHKMISVKMPNDRRVSPDTMVSVVANLLGIILILRHEDVNVITSKATAFIPRLK